MYVTQPGHPGGHLSGKKMAAPKSVEPVVYPPSINFAKNIVYGGFAGMVGSLFTFPIDLSKTLVQGDKAVSFSFFLFFCSVCEPRAFGQSPAESPSALTHDFRANIAVSFTALPRC
jgi:hypothetical protein